MKADCLSEAKGVMSRETGCALCLRVPACVSPPACPRGQAHKQEVLQASPPEELTGLDGMQVSC